MKIKLADGSVGQVTTTGKDFVFAVFERRRSDGSTYLGEEIHAREETTNELVEPKANRGEGTPRSRRRRGKDHLR